MDRITELLNAIEMNTRYTPEFQLKRMVELLESIDKKLDEPN